jgi:glutamine synthetase
MVQITAESVLKSGGIIKSLVTDLSGGLREIIFPAKIITELTTVGIAYDGSSFQGINEINCSDAIIVGDAKAIYQVPAVIADTDAPEYWVMCDIYTTDGAPHSNCARNRLKTIQAELAQVWDGGNMMVGAEPEAFFVENGQKSVGTLDGGNSNYFNPRDPKTFMITELVEILGEMGFEIERAHTEVGDEQFEINWRYDTAHVTADKIQLYKLVSHKLAQNYGFDVTFLPKPYANRNGSGMHFHLSVANEDRNLFYDATKEDQKYFSDKALHFLAGILKYSRSIAAVANSTEASYARLVPGYEAPCIIAIGSFNRSAACRIPAIADQNILAKALRAEFRFPDPLANPYLLGVAFITAGLLGLENEEKFKGFTDENLYALSMEQIRRKRLKLLPRNLWEAYSDFMMHPSFAEKFGKNIHKTYSDLILKEVDECQCHANVESMRRHYFA